MKIWEGLAGPILWNPLSCTGRYGGDGCYPLHQTLVSSDAVSVVKAAVPLHPLES